MDERRITHIYNIGKGHPHFVDPILDDERMAGIEHFVHQIEDELLHDEVAKDDHQQRNHNNLYRRTHNCFPR